MSLHIATGVLITDKLPLSAEEIADETAYWNENFAKINKYLMSVGMQPHHEPIDPKAAINWGASIKGSYDALVVAAEEIQNKSDYRFDHLLASAYYSLYLPIRIDTPLQVDPLFEIDAISGDYGSKQIGSSFHLYRECATLAKILGIYDLVRFPESKEKYGLEVERLNQLSSFDASQTYEVSGLSPMKSTDDWPPEATASLNFLTASGYSMLNGTAVFIYE